MHTPWFWWCFLLICSNGRLHTQASRPMLSLPRHVDLTLVSWWLLGKASRHRFLVHIQQQILLILFVRSYHFLSSHPPTSNPPPVRPTEPRKYFWKPPTSVCAHTCHPTSAEPLIPPVGFQARPAPNRLYIRQPDFHNWITSPLCFQHSAVSIAPKGSPAFLFSLNLGKLSSFPGLPASGPCTACFPSSTFHWKNSSLSYRSLPQRGHLQSLLFSLMIPCSLPPPHSSQHKITHLCVHLCSVAKLCPTLWDPVDCSTPDSSVFHCLPELAPIHAHWVGDAIQPSHPLSPPYLLALNLSQHRGLFQWVSLSHQVAKVLKLQLQHQSFQWIFRVCLLSISPQGSGLPESGDHVCIVRHCLCCLPSASKIVGIKK